jgi:hypothetical protein
MSAASVARGPKRDALEGFFLLFLTDTRRWRTSSAGRHADSEGKGEKEGIWRIRLAPFDVSLES